MRKLIHTSLIGSLLLAPTAIYAQVENTYSVMGMVYDDSNNPMPLADINLYDENGTLLVTISSEMDGTYKISELQPGKYRMTIEYIEMHTEEKLFTIVDQDVKLPNTVLRFKDVNDLKGTTVTGSRIAVQQKNDTMQYDAQAYKTNPDANAEDLLRKMPGMDMSSGSPKSQGESVTRILVDGKPFFGDDPAAALKNLPAEIISKIQVFDEKSEQSKFTGFDDGNTTKTINIILKDDKNSGVFGRVYGGGGLDALNKDNAANDFRYNAGGNINYFKGNRRISLIGMTNNVNLQNFESQDLSGVNAQTTRAGGGNRGGGMMRGGRGAGGNFMTGTREGIAATNSIGLNYSDKYFNKMDVTASYFFNNSTTDVLKAINRTYLLETLKGQVYDENSVSKTENYNHRFNARIDYQIDSSNSILLIPSLSYQKNNSTSNTIGLTSNNESPFLSKSSNDYLSDRNGWNGNLRALYRRKLNKPGRTFSIWADGGFNNTGGFNRLYALNEYVDYLLNDTLNQNSLMDQSGWNASSNFTYTEPLSKKSGLQVEYKVNYTASSSDKSTYDWNPLNNNYNLINEPLSSVFESRYLTNGGGLGYRYNGGKLSFNVNLNYQVASLQNEITYPQNGEIKRTFNNFVPQARLEYKIDRSKNLRFFYRTSTQNPNVTQLQNVINNSNPILLSTGNPNLDQSYNHMLRAMYNTSNITKNSTFFAMIALNKTQDYIANSTFVAPTDTVIGDIFLARGTQLTRPINLDGYYNVNSFATYGFPIKALRSNFNLNANVGHSRIPGLTNNISNFTNNTSLGLGFTISSNISEKIDFTLTSNGNYNLISNSYNTNINNEYYVQNSRLSMNYILWKGFTLGSDITNYIYRGLGGEFDQTIFLWNASIGKKFLKDNQAEIRLTAYDILGQNRSITPNTYDAYIERTTVNALQRYFMLTFSWNLRYFKGGATIKDMDSNRSNNFTPGGPQGMPHGMMPGGQPPMIR